MQVEELALWVAHDAAAAAVVVRLAGGGRGGRLEHRRHAQQAAALQRLEVAQQRRVRRAEARAHLLEVRLDAHEGEQAREVGGARGGEARVEARRVERALVAAQGRVLLGRLGESIS